MTWQSKHRRWIKKHRGKQYVVSCRQLGTAPTKEASLQAANEWWRQRESELDREHFQNSGSRAAWEGLSERLSKTGDIAKRNGHLPKLAAIRTEQAIVSRFRESLAAFPAVDPEASVYEALYDPPADESPEETLRLDRLAVLEARRQRALSKLAGRLPAVSLESLTAEAKRRSIRETVDAFLAEKLRQVQLEKLTAGRYDALTRMSKCFVDWLVADKGKATAHDVGTNEIDASTLPGYLQHIELARKSKGWSDSFAADVFSAAKQLIQWAYSREHLDQLPRSFQEKNLCVKIRKGKPVALAVETAKLLLATKDERLRLYVLLALNTAATQIDVSEIRNSEIDWTDGRIIRKREKTSDCENVPEVNYKLWPETLRLLAKHRSADTSPESRVLLNRNGQPLKSEAWREKRYRYGKRKGEPFLDGSGKPVVKLFRNDAIRNAFVREVRRLKLDPAPCFKMLRKCGVTTLKGLGVSPDLRSHYLDHSARSIREAHYEGESPEFQARFDEAIAKLGRVFGLVE